MQISQIETPWEAHDRGALAFLFLQNINRNSSAVPRVCFWVLYKQLLLQRGKGDFKTQNKNACGFVREFQNSKLLKYQGKHLVSLQAQGYYNDLLKSKQGGGQLGEEGYQGRRKI